jgi:hypothetical protein
MSADHKSNQQPTIHPPNYLREQDIDVSILSTTYVTILCTHCAGHGGWMDDGLQSSAAKIFIEESVCVMFLRRIIWGGGWGWSSIFNSPTRPARQQLLKEQTEARDFLTSFPATRVSSYLAGISIHLLRNRAASMTSSTNNYGIEVDTELHKTTEERGFVADGKYWQMFPYFMASRFLYGCR